MGLVFITPIMIRSESSVISKNLRYSSKMQEIPAKTKMSEKNNSIVTFGYPGTVSYTHLTLPTTPYV